MDLNCEKLSVDGYEEVVFCEEPKTGLRAIVAIHNTNLGPACGGIRLLPYSSKEEGLNDVLRLSKGMSYKSALAGIQFGGGKSVIFSDPEKKSPELFQAFGEFVERFEGRYISAKDMNVNSEDLVEVKKRTEHVLGIEGVTGSGDPSPVTARAAFGASRATIEEAFETESFEGIRFAIQGLGHVGFQLADYLNSAGAELIVTDIDPQLVNKAVEAFGARAVEQDSIYSVPCDVFAPCAVGGILNEKNIAQLQCRAVVGCANNQLASNEDGYRLHERGILYAPDYAVNSGGIINVFMEFEGYDEGKAMNKADGVYQTVREIYARSRRVKRPPFVVANELAEERLYGNS